MQKVVIGKTCLQLINFWNQHDSRWPQQPECGVVVAEINLNTNPESKQIV